jgi:phosphotriesterase-related protein
MQQDSGASALSRRRFMRLLGTGAGLGAPFAPVQDLVRRAVQSDGRLQFPPGAIVRTILRDVDPRAIAGSTLVHEHVGSGRPGKGPVERPSQDRHWMAEELKAARRAGLACIVSANASLTGADTEYLTFLAGETGLHVVAAGGYYTLAGYPPEVKTNTEDQIADALVEAARIARFGMFGEIGVANGHADLDPLERKVFRAIGKAHLRTGVPILTHNNYATGPHVPEDIALRQLDAFESVGVKPERVALGHVCCLDDPAAKTTKQLCRRGAFVAFDRVTRQQQWVTDEQRLKTILSLLDAGYTDHVMLSSDNIGGLNPSTGEKQFYPGPLHARDGGPGYARPLLLFVPLMRQAGIEEETIRRITQDNPRRFLAFVPKEA